MDTGPITHERARELATTAIDFDLAPAEWDLLEAHLATCQQCERFALATRRDQARLAALPQYAAPTRIHEKLRHAESTKRDRIRPLVVIAAAGMAGALAFATLGGGARPQPAESQDLASAAPSIALVAPTIITAPPSSAAPSSAAPASASPQPPPEPLAWEAVASQASFHDPYGVMEAVAAGQRLVAVGDGCGESLPTCHMAIWTSQDGETWQRVPDSPEFQAGGYTLERRGELTDVVATDAGFLAVGRSREAGIRRAAVFWSDDGLHWTRSTDDASLLLGTMEAVVSTPRGFVAVGNVVDGPAASAGVWTSPDGLAWVRASGSAATFAVGGEGTFTDGRQRGGMIDVAWTGTRLVSVGSACEPRGGRCRGVAWTSDDGRSWARHGNAIDGTPYAMTTVSGALVAVGDDGDGHPVSWTSDDGGAWTAGRPVSAFDGNFDAVVVTPSGLVATIVTSDLRSVVATSVDGRSWHVVADPGALGQGVINGMGWDPVRDIAVGVGWDGRTLAAAVWLGR